MIFIRKFNTGYQVLDSHMIDLAKIKSDFPIYDNDPSLVYLDSTATSLKPKKVVAKLREYYEKYSANIYRGLYKISEKATEEYEDTRQLVAKFINAKSPDEVIFTRGTTESLNLVAYAHARQRVGRGDEIVTSVMEHHSNFVPWQQLALENGVTLKVIDIDDHGYLDIIRNSEVRIQNLITKKTRIIALTYISNVLGTVNPIKEIATAAKKINPEIVIVVDAAQAAPHIKIDVQDLGCDFLTFSSHKMLGPTGVGVLWGKYELLEAMFPFQFGGEMITEVHLDRTIFKKPPHKFEAGTPHIAGVIAFKEAIRYLQSLGWKSISEHEKSLTIRSIDALKEAFGEEIKIFGPDFFGVTEKQKGGIVAFSFAKFHPHDVAQILDEENIAVRAGHHCAMPLHKRLGVVATTRASFYIYNSEKDTEKLVNGLRRVKKILS